MKLINYQRNVNQNYNKIQLVFHISSVRVPTVSERWITIGTPLTINGIVNLCVNFGEQFGNR